MSRLFVSHSSVNNAEAVAIRDWLRDNGWDDVFLDLDPRRGIVAGERWEKALNDAARRCEAVIFLVSRAWLASDWCERELNLANKLNKRLFGVVIEELAVSDIPPRITATWQVVQLATGRDHVPFDVTLPVTGDLKHVYFSAEGLARLKAGLKQAGLHPGFFDWPPEKEPNRPPYRGLKSLEAQDAGIFFGREAEIIEALDRLRGLSEGPPPRLLVILGASGAGKSSFLRAGLWPRLRRDDRNFLPLPVIRPGQAVISGDAGLVENLQEAFKVINAPRTRAEIRKAVEGGSGELLPLLLELAQKAAPPPLNDETPKAPTLVFPIDQGEELFLLEGADEAEAFLALFRDALAATSPACVALITIRSDAYERLQTAPMLETVLPKHTLSLPPISKGAYCDIIEGPVRRLSNARHPLNVEPALSNAILHDIDSGSSKDALPLLAFTLERLYLDFGAGGSLTLADYEELGRIKGSIEAAVNRALQASEADPTVPRDRNAKLALLRRGLIPWLAGVDVETGAPRRRVSLYSEIPPATRPLIDSLVEARLLSTDKNRAGDTTIEPNHEALLRQWGDLEGWLKEDRVALTTLEGVKRATTDWITNGKSAAWLSHRSGRLEEAGKQAVGEAFANFLTADERAYIAACRAAENTETLRKRRQDQAITYGSLIAAGVLLVVAAIAVWKWIDAQQQSQIAQDKSIESNRRLSQALELESRFRAEQSQRQLQAGHPVEAILLAMAGLPDPATNEIEQKARRSIPETQYAYNYALAHLSERIVLAGHFYAVNSAAFSPDGKRIVTGSSDNTARLWDAETGKSIGEPLKGHESYVYSVAFSPDGKLVATASFDKTARLWDAATGKPIGEPLRGHQGPVNSVAFSPDGRRIVTGSTDKTARLWDRDTGKSIGEPLIGHEALVKSVAFSPDGRRIITASSDGSGSDNTTRLWDAETGKLIGEPLRDAFQSASFSPDGRRIIALSYDNTARLWDAETLKPFGEPLKHQGVPSSVAFSPDGGRIVIASIDGTITLWDAKTLKPLGEPLKHFESVLSAAFSPDGRRIVTASSDKTARLWDIETEKPISLIKGHENAVWSAAFSPDGRRIVTASWDKTARLWDAETGQPIGEPLKGHEGPIYSAAFSPDGRRIVTASEDKTARLWDAATGKPIGEPLIGHQGNVHRAAFSPDGKRIVTASGDNTARLWDAETGKTIGRPLKEGSCAEFSPDGRRIVTASGVWDAESLEPIGEPLHQGPISSAAFSPDGKRIVTASYDKTARLWDAATGKPAGVPLIGHESTVNSVAFSPDGKRIVTASGDNTARLWDAETGKLVAEPLKHEMPVLSAAFSPDGRRIVTASSDGISRVWYVPGEIDIEDRLPRCLSGEQLVDFKLTSAPPWCLRKKKYPYSPSAQLVAARSIHNGNDVVSHLTELIAQLESSPADVLDLREAVFLRGQTYKTLRRYPDAIADFRRAAALGETDTAGWVWWATERHLAEENGNQGDLVAHLLSATSHFLSLPASEASNMNELRSELKQLTYPIGEIFGNNPENSQTPTDCDKFASHPYDPLRTTTGINFKDLDFAAALSVCTAEITRTGGTPRDRYLIARAYAKAAGLASETGDDQLASKYYAAMLVNLNKAYRSGYFFSLNSLAGAFADGEGVKKDGAKAAALYLENFNRIVACCATRVMTSMLRSEGLDKGQVLKVAEALLKWAADLGDPAAHRELAELYVKRLLQPSVRTNPIGEAYVHLKLSEALFAKAQQTEAAKAAKDQANDLAAKIAEDELATLSNEIERWRPEHFTADPPWLRTPFASK